MLEKSAALHIKTSFFISLIGCFVFTFVFAQKPLPFPPKSGFAQSADGVFVIYAPNQLLADDLLEKSQFFSSQISKGWFGDNFKCDTFKCMVHFGHDDKLNVGWTEASTWPIDHPKRKYHSITIRVKPDDNKGLKIGLSSTLRHELTHAIMASHFGYNVLPDWANEGVASLQDDDDRKNNLITSLAQYVSAGKYPLLINVINKPVAERYGGNREFYNVSVSFSEFLMELAWSDPAIKGYFPLYDRFFTFAVETQKLNIDKSISDKDKKAALDALVKKFYNRPSLAVLENNWHSWLRKKYGSKK